jgi:SAM-dependent methyltransferase
VVPASLVFGARVLRMSEEVSARGRPPVPPFDLAHRVMAIDRAGAEREYRAHGQGNKETIVSLLPDDWNFDGKRVLDFGCGAGRVMSAFADEAQRCEFHGCDVDRRSIGWIQRHLVPPFHVFANPAAPGRLPFEDGSVDLIYAISVFSHLADGWNGWLAELHRCLAPDGYLLATFLGQASSETIAGEPWDPDRIGMNVLFPDQSWESGGPMVFVSEWWLRARWGRAFELEPYVEAMDPAHQDWGVFRKKPVEASAELFDRPEPCEEREVHALRHNLRRLRHEHEATERALRAELARITSSPSWRLTAPLRRLKRRRQRRKSA